MFRPQVLVSIAFLTGAMMSSVAMAAPTSHQGKVATVGKGELAITYLKSSELKMFSVDSTCKITLDGQPAKLVDLQVGFIVDISAEMNQDGKLSAKMVSASSKLPPKR